MTLTYRRFVSGLRRCVVVWAWVLGMALTVGRAGALEGTTPGGAGEAEVTLELRAGKMQAGYPWQVQPILSHDRGFFGWISCGKNLPDLMPPFPVRFYEHSSYHGHAFGGYCWMEPWVLWEMNPNRFRDLRGRTMEAVLGRLYEGAYLQVCFSTQDPLFLSRLAAQPVISPQIPWWSPVE